MYCTWSLLRMIFASLACANERVQNVRDFPQTKLDSEINAHFLLNEHGDPHFLFYKFNENNILNNWEKNWQKSMATFLANEINATDRDVTGSTEQVQIMFLWRIKILINDARYMKLCFLGHRWINNQRKSNLVWYNTPHWKITALICCELRSPKVTLITVFVSIVKWKQARWPPLFITFFNISLSCNINIPSFIGNLWWDLLLGNHQWYSFLYLVWC